MRAHVILKSVSAKAFGTRRPQPWTHGLKVRDGLVGRLDGLMTVPSACGRREPGALAPTTGGRAKYPRPVREIRDQHFRLKTDRGGLVVEDLSFHNCTF